SRTRPFPELELLSAELEAAGYHDILADYWNAKPLIVASKERQAVCQIAQGGLVLTWINNDAWCGKVYQDLDHGPSLVPVIGDRLDRTALEAAWGSPLASRTIQGHEIWLFPRDKVQARIAIMLCSTGSPFVSRERCPRAS